MVGTKKFKTNSYETIKRKTRNAFTYNSDSILYCSNSSDRVFIKFINQQNILIMKTFIYTTKEKNQTYGVKYIVDIFQVKNNKPELLGTINYQSGGYRGHDSEVTRFIVQNKYLPKNCLDKSGYLNYNKRGVTFQLYNI